METRTEGAAPERIPQPRMWKTLNEVAISPEAGTEGSTIMVSPHSIGIEEIDSRTIRPGFVFLRFTMDEARGLMAQGWVPASQVVPMQDTLDRLRGCLSPVKSSNLKAVGFFVLPDPMPLRAHPEVASSGRMVVEFNNGTLWAYDGVSGQQFREVRDAESVGKAFNAAIKGNKAYNAHRLDGDGAQP